MSHQMQSFVFIGVIGFLKYSDIICTAFMQITIFVGIYRIDFKTDHAEILSCKFTCLTNVFYITFCPAFSSKNQDFFHTRISNYFHLMGNLFHIKLHTINMVITVKSTVHAIILTIVCNIKRCKQIYCISKMFTCLYFRFLRHLL